MRLVLHLARWWSARHYLLRTGPFAKAQSVWKKPFITHKDNKCSGPTNNDAILNSLSWYTCYLTLYKALIIKSRLHSFSSCWRGASHNHLVRGTRNLHGPWFRLVRGALQASLRGGMKWCCSKHFVFGGAGKIHGEMRGKRGKEMQPYCWGCGYGNQWLDHASTPKGDEYLREGMDGKSISQSSVTFWGRYTLSA